MHEFPETRDSLLVQVYHRWRKQYGGMKSDEQSVTNSLGYKLMPIVASYVLRHAIHYKQLCPAAQVNQGPMTEMTAAENEESVIAKTLERCKSNRTRATNKT